MNIGTMLRDSAGRLRSGWRLAVFLVLTVSAVLLLNVGWRAAGLPRQRIDGVFQPWPFLGLTAAIVPSTIGIAWLALRRFEGCNLSALGRRRTAFVHDPPGSLSSPRP